MRAFPHTLCTAVFGLVAVVGWLFPLLPAAAQAQTAATQCTLTIEGSGGTGAVMVNASGCGGDVAIIAKAGSNQKQFPVGSGAEIYQPFNLSPCDLGITGEKAVSVTYTAVVLNGVNKGKASPAYSGTIQPPPTRSDAPPSVSFSGHPGPGTFVKPDDSILLSVTARDDVGLTAIKVTDPEGHIILDRAIKPAPAPAGECHAKSGGQTETFDIRKPYVVPQNPPTPLLKYTAVVRDTAGHETTGFAEYWTEAVWNGRMIVETSGIGSNFVCRTNWHVELWIKTSPENEISGTAEGRHSPPLSCPMAANNRIAPR
jgi:hypothetical protein